ncbi:anaerobic ribonucleoside-triphosphate reductase activating protein [Anaerobacillus alkalilacustris]|uniref:Anaerobic ribonucleoside-triphosphate reductase-activating protein n=1 Tax=Anaerobacillus alkalilacustris TaxID=393763 RepID=A0A1S2LK08_9BACI|nr:anaerobic ribonucleoside-triphosphate reductase activating protein [Anaerobacillus alkalilacustris]OIJ12530.1 anaerobic ribonucleoside-triphosphate reductase activating protein [Anaerobacillus alkalilacustris]
MKVLGIKEDSIVDGEGLRTVIYFAGCSHQCPGCHNPQSWQLHAGTDYTLDELLQSVCVNPLNDITFSGGDPFFQAKNIVPLAKALKQAGKNIWAYTGYTIEELLQRGNQHELELLEYVDVLVDGRFIEKEKDLSLTYRGSRNQRIIYLRTLFYSKNPKENPVISVL